VTHAHVDPNTTMLERAEVALADVREPVTCSTAFDPRSFQGQDSRVPTLPTGVVLLSAAIIATSASGVTLAASHTGSDHYHACATSHHVLVLLSHGHCPRHSHRVSISVAGPRGPRGRRGATGAADIAPVISVYNDNGYHLTSASDDEFHTIATLPVAAAGGYTATATVVTGIGVSGAGQSECALIAQTNPSGVNTDYAYATLQGNGQTSETDATLSLELDHVFTGAGSIELRCRQESPVSGGVLMHWDNAKITALRVTVQSNNPVTQ
jgi:hypothetical protein